MMFKGRIFSLALVFLCLAAYTAWFFHAPTAKDYRFYRRLMTVSDSEKPPESSQTLAKQERVNVQKQLVFNQDNQRLQWRLESAKSDVELHQNDHSVELFERLHEMKCTMQEKIEPDSFQIIRQIEAEEALYRYKHKQLWAEHVKLARYYIPEKTQWIQNFSSYQPFMDGQAQTIHMLFGKTPNFKAQDFQATLQEWK